jgi:hypothetical protein
MPRGKKKAAETQVAETLIPRTKRRRIIDTPTNTTDKVSSSKPAASRASQETARSRNSNSKMYVARETCLTRRITPKPKVKDLNVGPTIIVIKGRYGIGKGVKNGLMDIVCSAYVRSDYRFRGA